MNNLIKASLIYSSVFMSVLPGYAEPVIKADAPFTVPAGLFTAGAPSLTIPTTLERTFTASELTAAAANNTIVSLINSAIQNNTLIHFPAGTYNIPAVIFISGKSNVVLQGATNADGTPATTLNFTKSLTQLYGNDTVTYGTFGAWHGGGGLITIGAKHPFYSNGGTQSSQKIGIENFNITFNRTIYKAPEAGYNGLYFNKASNSYAKNVNVDNFDNAWILSLSTHTTVLNSTINATRGGHFGAVIYKGSYNRVENLVSLTAAAHQLAVQGTSFNVFKNCTVAKSPYDSVSYRGGSNTNLFWNINGGSTLLGASNGQDSTLASTYGPNEYYWNCMSKGSAFSAARVPAFLAGYVFAYYGTQASPLPR